MGYRNWRQRWCKKEGNKVLEKKNETKILYLAHVNVKEVLHIVFFFSLNLVQWRRSCMAAALFHMRKIN